MAATDTPTSRFRRLQGIFFALLCFGCASTDKLKTSGLQNAAYYEVTAPATSFWYFGPQQPNGPDLKLEKGRLLTLVKRSMGYSQVKLESGQEGWIATGDIAPMTGDFVASRADAALMNVPPENSGAIVERYYVNPSDPNNQVPLPAGATAPLLTPEPLPDATPSPLPPDTMPTPKSTPVPKPSSTPTFRG